MTKEEILEKHSCTAIMTDEDFYFESEVIKALEEYANQEKEKEAILFKEWNDSNLEGKSWEQYDTSDRWINPYTRQVISTKQLYELYKQQS